MRRAALLAAAGMAALSQGVHASWDTSRVPVFSMPSTGVVKVTPGASDLARLLAQPARTIAPVVGSPGTLVVTDPLDAPPGPKGPLNGGALKRTLPWSSIAGKLARSLPAIGTAVAVVELLEELRCRSSSGSPECDAGQPEVTDSGWCTSGGYCAATKQASCDAYVAATWNAAVRYGVPVTEGANLWCKVYNNSDGSFHVQAAQYPGGTFTSCPAIVVSGVTVYPTTGPDGKCPTGVYGPIGEADLEDKIDDHGDKSKAPAVVSALEGAGLGVPHSQPEVVDLPSVQADRVRTDHPDGSVTVRDTDWPFTITTDGYRWDQRVREETYPPGATIPDPGSLGTPTTTTGPPSSSEFKGCGLPGTPPCKIDESGTPPADPPPDDPADTASPLRGIIDNPQVADTSWTWTFSLPTSCSVITLGPWAGQTIDFDLCQYQPMIHDIVSIVWLISGLWFGVSLVGRTLGT